MARNLNLGTPLPLSTAQLAEHCAVCREAARYLYRDPQPHERGALTILMLTHRQNDEEREEFFKRYLRFLFGDRLPHLG